MFLIDKKIISDFFDSDGRELYRICEDTVKEFRMSEFLKSGVLVGFSGGADSILLLSFLLEYRRRNSLDFSILLVHVNHGIRGDEAKRDEDFCIKAAEMLQIPIEVLNFSVPNIAKEEHIGVEEAARNVRYSAFNEIIQGRNDIGAISVAHNMSDNAETVILNILRGSGSRGACGIPPVRDNIIRPLIRISKPDIISALNSFGIPYVVDSTNFSTDYTRNYIRAEIIPRLSRISDAPDLMISRFADNLRSDSEFIDFSACKLIAENNTVSAKALYESHYSVYVRALSLLAERAGCRISSKIAEDIHELLSKDNFSYSLIGGELHCERGVCRVCVSSCGNCDFFYRINEGMNHPSSEYDVIISREFINENYSNIYKSAIQVNLSSAIIDGELYLRPKKDGDTIYYGGMTHKLKKLFNDRKIPLSERRRLPILCDNRGVLWVPGFGVRDDAVEKEERVDLFVLLGYLS